MANMWSGKDYWKHFVGFADRSNAAGITEGNLENATSFDVISGNKRTIQGTENKRSDTSKLQHGTNYSEQHGDSISVQKGNKSSIQSQGWSNSVMEGISFSTTSGGSFATTGGFSIATHVGPKIATYAGVEVSNNSAVSLKIASGWVQEIYLSDKKSMAVGPEISLKSSYDEYSAAVKMTYAVAKIVATHTYTTVANSIFKVGNKNDECLSSSFKSGEHKEVMGISQQRHGSLTVDVAGLDSKHSGSMRLSSSSIIALG